MRRFIALVALAAIVAGGAAVGRYVVFSTASDHSAAIRHGVQRYLGEPAVVFPICIDRADPTYARAGVYPIPVNYSFPFQVVLHRSRSAWHIVAENGYDALGWLTLSRYPTTVTREPWCHAVPHTPTAIRAALRKKLAVVSTFGLTFPYVPVIGAPLYKPSSLGYSVDGGAIYGIRKWLSYGKESAQALASWEYNPCTPSCATGHPRTLVTFVLTLTRPKPCKDVIAYTTLTVTRSSNTQLFPNRSWSLQRFFCT